MATRVNVLDYAPNVFWEIANAVLPRFESLTGLDRPFIRDFSIYDGEKVNLSVSQINGCQLVANRYAMGWSGVDRSFRQRYDQAGDIGMWRTGYSVLYPSLSVQRQVDHWVHLFPEIDTIPRVVDAELQDGQSDGLIGEKIWHACELIKKHDGVYPIVYSRYLLLDKWLRYWTPEMLKSIYFWGARYMWDRTREHPGPVHGKMTYTKIPEENWIIHQTADKKRPYPGETDRQTIADWDRWLLGDEAAMHEWISHTWCVSQPLETTWYEDIDFWARKNGFESEHEPPKP